MKITPLESGNYYHIYNRGINNQTIFNTDENKRYFLKLITRYFEKNISLLAFCIMGNHFHLVVKINSESKKATQIFSNLLNAYAKAYNKQNSRTGSLFEKQFKRIKIKSETYLRNLIIYVHKNPTQYINSNNLEHFEHSSYRNYVNPKLNAFNTIDTSMLGRLFDDIENFKYLHQQPANLEELKSFGKSIDKQDLQGFGNLAGSNIAGSTANSIEGTIKDRFFNYIQKLQDTITSKLEVIDDRAKFKEDIWKRSEGGGGRSRIIENGNVFEKGGVNISAVHGELPETMQRYFNVKDADFFACGLSLVLHPINPMAPTVHANWRYFEMYNGQGKIVDQWFGGGQDLTPYYLFEEDAKHFHQICKTVCDRHDQGFYKKYKAQCDDYFHNAHRNEARGVGGLFFDYCKETDSFKMQDWYDFVTDVGDNFLEAYLPVLERTKNIEYDKEHRNWQEIRRGRYVEFNLVHDKGTLFGLKTNGRIESILMSLPPKVQWVYDHKPKPGSEEEKLIDVLKNPREWVF